MFRHLLVPTEDSVLSQATVEGAVAYARDCGAKLTFFHVRADYGATSDGTVVHALSPDAYAQWAAGHAAAVLAKAEAAARAKAVECRSVAVTSDRVHEAIVEAAKAEGCDLIFMASRGQSWIRRTLQGSVTHKVLELATIPVLVFAVGSNLALSDEQRAVALLKDEHRSLAAVILGLQHELRRRTDAGHLPHFALLRAMLFYIRKFPQRLHHPKEEEFIFRRLRLHTRECDALIERLEQQHVQGDAELGRLDKALDAWIAGEEGAAAAFREAVSDFAQTQWQHMGMEEEELLPAAGRFLQPADWKEVAQAFLDNNDPRLHKEVQESYASLFKKLMNLAAAG